MPIVGIGGHRLRLLDLRDLSRSVTDPYHYRYFPPFQPNLNCNLNDHLGAEYFHMARALRAGEGFAHPFEEKTGPTAWMPPVLPVTLAGLLWVCHDDRDTVMDIVIGLQVAVLIGTGILVLELARRTSQRAGTKMAALLFIGFFLLDFFLWFQFTHDSWLVLLILDLLVAGLCWLRPFGSWQRSARLGSVWRTLCPDQPHRRFHLGHHDVHACRAKKGLAPTCRGRAMCCAQRGSVVDSQLPRFVHGFPSSRTLLMSSTNRNACKQMG